MSRLVQLPFVVDGPSEVSPASSRAIFLADMTEERSAETSLASSRRLEPVHLHGISDTSLHVCLPKAREAESAAFGWGEPHQYGDFSTEFMIYGTLRKWPNSRQETGH